MSVDASLLTPPFKIEYWLYRLSLLTTFHILIKPKNNGSPHQVLIALVTRIFRNFV